MKICYVIIFLLGWLQSYNRLAIAASDVTIIPGTIVERYQKGAAGFVKMTAPQETPKGFLNIVMVGNGFKTDAEQAVFEKTALSSINKLFEEEPFLSHALDFNIYLVKVPNGDFGATHTSSIDMLSLKDEGAFAKKYTTQAIKDFYHNKNIKFFRELTFLTVILNESTGRASADRGAKVIILLGQGPDQDLVYCHEMGHSFGNLADEYSNVIKKCDVHDYDNDKIGQFGLNITTNTSKPPFWAHLVGKEDGTEGVCPNGQMVGVMVNNKRNTCDKPEKCLVGGTSKSPEKCRVGVGHIPGVANIGFAGAGRCSSDGTSTVAPTAWRPCFRSKMETKTARWCLVNEMLLGKMFDYYKSILTFLQNFTYPAENVGHLQQSISINPSGTLLSGAKCSFVDNDNPKNLPSGLRFNPETCSISGIPRKVQASEPYTVRIHYNSDILFKEFNISIQENSEVQTKAKK